MTTILYGINNCDTIKKTKKWLKEHDITFDFHDYRKNGIDSSLVKMLMDQLGWENIINKRGLTYRQLSAEQKDNLTETSSIAILVEYPAMIKRPILKKDGQLFIGFNQDEYSELFNMN